MYKVTFLCTVLISSFKDELNVPEKGELKFLFKLVDGFILLQKVIDQ